MMPFLSFLVQQDTSAIQAISAIPPSGAITFGGAAVIGALAATATGIVKRGAMAVDKLAGNEDQKIKNLAGPVLPIVATLMGVILPVVGNSLHITNLPSADVIASAPLSAVLGVAMKEGLSKWVLPLLGKLK